MTLAEQRLDPFCCSWPLVCFQVTVISTFYPEMEPASRRRRCSSTSGSRSCRIHPTLGFWKKAKNSWICIMPKDSRLQRELWRNCSDLWTALLFSVASCCHFWSLTCSFYKNVPPFYPSIPQSSGFSLPNQGDFCRFLFWFWFLMQTGRQKSDLWLIEPCFLLLTQTVDDQEFRF